MNFKQFLKPDSRKILLFAIFLILAFYLLLGGYPTGCLLPEYRGLECWMVDFLYDFLGFPIILIWYESLALIIELIYLYLLSCLIIWIYEKVKKK